MADNKSSQPIPNGWKYETKTTREGSEFSSFIRGKDDKQNLDGIDSELILSSAKVVDLKTFEETPSALETNDPKYQFSAKPKISNNSKKRRRGQI